MNFSSFGLDTIPFHTQTETNDNGFVVGWTLITA